MSKFRKGDVVKVKLAAGKTIRGILIKQAAIGLVDIVCEGEYADHRTNIDNVEQINNLNIFDMLREKGVIA